MKLKQLEKNELREIHGGLAYWFLGLPVTFAPWIEKIIEKGISYSSPN